MASARSAVSAQFRQKYTEVLQQRLKRYRMRLTNPQRHTFYLCVSLAVLGGVFLLSCLTEPVRKIVVNHLDCRETECTYTFRVDKALGTHTYVYGVVGRAAQTHMKYDMPTVETIDMIKRTIIAEETLPPGKVPDMQKCAPYIKNGQWVYPCGISISTFPQDVYKIFRENGVEVPMAIDPLKARIDSWVNPSSFLKGSYKIGEIEGLEPGAYTLHVQKQISHPLPDREVVILGNIGRLGTSFHSAGGYIADAAILLAIVNSFACMASV